ncbi:MAG: nuclear transport factor 2 family protein [Thermoleophilia bacterium]
MTTSPVILEQVEAANRAFYDAFQNGDIGAMEACWRDGPGVSCVHPGGPIISGWPLVRASWEAILESEPEFVMDIEVVDVTVEDPVAWVTCLERMSRLGHAGRAGAQVVATNMFVLDATGWRLSVHHASPVM